MFQVRGIKNKNQLEKALLSLLSLLTVCKKCRISRVSRQF
ncbi:hypothetical protein FAEPRAM212_02179 [Faecalibacterium prausnitzii M21/2]|uniref:Uncharacterized protein n=1 Tax=Faecalibacterium prausnitzii M21/2 TaxID=411485 RepID=A8SDC2_9FIRM|nr:hypothetical protein FAEPRAM212_02179 [Faecalibacterium prausnitzii M21/2]